MIKHLRNNQIDKKIWDKTIEASINPLVYAKSWYLDLVSPNWEALVLGDYEAIMPLPVKRKYGVRIMLQPPYCQQLGLFSCGNLMPETAEKFIRYVQHHFAHLNLQINSCFVTPKNSATGINYELCLNSGYTELHQAYSTNTRRNLAKAKKSGLELRTLTQASDFMTLKRLHLKTQVSDSQLRVLESIVNRAVASNASEILAVYSSEGVFQAAAFFLLDGKRAYYLNAFSSEAGMQSKAMFFLIDAFIQRNASSGITLDFEGSGIESIARFYAGFGAKPTSYYKVRSTNLLALLTI